MNILNTLLYDLSKNKNTKDGEFGDKQQSLVNISFLQKRFFFARVLSQSLTQKKSGD